ncbi:hypothetical protein Dester_0357 [Desulfurobacterium thermolithotrophum DSM 11699]|uniref:Uncharacterized protein n=1 Tax=Desulfurobacterium thermolithotrophum (strain DSM 11699 / BSA) TaxID=868864 RepID=F0S270_DESTD|nr:hypothetical protein [Desulfurobacterium thermolithotrophum]ADY73013.1 hypothetical protein Dester_0357 [Desulfurobacterium thermolithotrophum DSM 11699]
MGRALKNIFFFRKWISAVELVLYIFMLLTLFLTAYKHLFGGHH